MLDQTNKTNFYVYNTLCSERVYDLLFHKHKVTSGTATQMFHKLIVEGLNAHKGITVRVNTLLPVNHHEQNKKFWKSEEDRENGIIYKSLPMINIGLFGNLFTFCYVFFHVLLYRFPRKEQNIIVTDYLRLSLNAAVVFAAKIRNIKVLTFITDMPGESVRHTTFKAKVRNKIAIILNFDYYVCLTKYLNEALNKKNRPSVVIEGFANWEFNKKQNLLEDKFEERVLVYAGALYERYGIKTLIEAFILLPDDDLRLWLYGTGPFVDEIKHYEALDERVKYQGVLAHDELLKVLIKSTLLVNPRPSHEIFTLYSFPSKNMEYMSTGTPLLTTKLPGIPKDHFPYVFFITEENVMGLKNNLFEILKKNSKSLHDFGSNAKKFVMKEKNNIKQTEKILSILQ
ncbi:MAG: glycosyltransferase [Firmicutes bacterium]|nr:glycosyltransferase [Bacillota bacterium]